MCTVLGWVQGWWSVNGLAIEIVGFAVLSLDVAREYARHRTVERYRAGAAAAQRLVNAKPSSNEPEAADDDYQVLLEKNHAMHDRGVAMMAWYVSLPRKDRKNYDPYSHNFAEIAATLPIKADHIAAQPYRRAPIRFGIFLVLVGATLQMVGSWPCG